VSGRRASVVVAVVSFLVGAGISALLLHDNGPAADSPSARSTGEQVAAPTTSSAPVKPSATKTSSPKGTPSTVTTARPGGHEIALDSRTDFARPFETVGIAGTYRGVDAPTTLRVQMRSGAGWKEFPLPVTTAPSGTFRAYVELGKPGKYRLRILDPATNTASGLFTLLIF
jgi:hypothetical protein